ncbi:MAG: hypothetical protein ABW149_01725 [Sedimenticola sp.]
MSHHNDDHTRYSTEVAAPARGASATTPRAQSGGEYHSAGAPLSNTAPANCMEPDNTRILRVGVDSLYLSYPGSLSDDAAIRLKVLKELAQSREEDSQKLAQYAVEDHVFQVSDRGRFPFQYILRDGWYRIELSGSHAERTPLAHVQLASEALTFQGPLAMEADLRSVISSLGQLEGEATVGRVDLCVDFTTSTDISAIPERNWVTRARLFDFYTVQRQFSGLTIGKGGDLSARLYNKALEVSTSKKDYMFDIWQDLGWNHVDDVWRLEFQFRRPVLRQLGIREFSSLLSSLGGLWQYATNDWLRLTCPTPSDNTQSRWPTHPLWAVLSAADWGTEQGCYRQHTPKDTPPSDKSLFINGLSGLTSFMAREGITDPHSGAPAFFRAAKDFHEGRAHFTGLSFDDYILQKVQAKARRYGTMVNQPEGKAHPADAAVAREYRRRSDGE